MLTATTASPARRSWVMVADAEELVADEPDVTVRIGDAERIDEKL